MKITLKMTALLLAGFGMMSVVETQAAEKRETKAPAKGKKNRDKSAAEIADEMRLGVRKVGTKVGNAVDDFLENKASKARKSARK